MIWTRGTIVAAAFAVCLQPSLRAETAQDPAARERGSLIDVPYVAQSPALCGGAAVAMVLRFWGDAEVLPEDFQHLVDTRARGIATNVLTAAVSDAGWTALASHHGATDGLPSAEAQLAMGRPVIALIDAGGRVYHYVVIVGLTREQVVFHDPARRAFSTLSRDAFDRAWAVADRWSMTILPGAPRPSPPPAVSAPVAGPASPVASAPCAAVIASAVERARMGRVDQAEAGLRDAAALCPAAAAPWRELAGLRFQQSRWTEARDLAGVAVTHDAADGDAQQLLAASRFMLGDELGALAAWNSLNEPRTDIVDIRGNANTPAPAVIRLLRLTPRQVLSTGDYQRAERRLAELPAAAITRLRYVPLPGGRVTVRAAVVEHARYPAGWMALGEIGARAALTSQVEVPLSNLLRAGDQWAAAWRWSDARPRISGALAIPAPVPLPGTLTMDVSWERQTYSVPGPAATVVPKSRRQVGLSLEDWATGDLRWHVGGAMDRLDARARVRLDAGLDHRRWRDRLALRGQTSWWSPGTGGAGRLWSARASAALRSTTERSVPTWYADAGWTWVSDRAPLALWPGAGTGQGREALLRAHPLLESDVVAGPAFGRTLAHGTVEYRHPVLTHALGQVSLAGFADAAQSRRGLGAASPVNVDVGVGVRVGAPTWAGSLRIDLARGVRDGQMALSAGWTLAWPQ